MANAEDSRGPAKVFQDKSTKSRRGILSRLACAVLMATFLGGCAVAGLFTPKAEEADIRAGFAVLAKAYAWAQQGQTIVTTVPSVTTYTSSDETVTLKVELIDGAPSPFPTEINTYTLNNFKSPDYDIVVVKAQIRVENTRDGFSETTKVEKGSADFSGAGTLERLDFSLYGKQIAWGEGVNYDFFDGAKLDANYKAVGYLRVPMIY